MSEWKEVTEEGQVYFVNEELGNILKGAEGCYISLMPKIVRLGPFETLEQAQKVMDERKTIDEMIDTTVDTYNENILQLMKQAKSE